MNLREAAQQALELLEEIHPGNMTPLAEGAWNTAITALRAALAEDAMQRLTDVQHEIENSHQVTGDHLRDATKMVATIKDNLTVEPVAWLQIGMGDHEGTVIATTSKPKTWNLDWWRFEPLYTAPPKRKPLTENQIRRIDDDTPFHEGPEWLVRFTRAVERAHGIGGEE